jgi:hypothetical protein
MDLSNAHPFDWLWLACGVGALLFTSLNAYEGWIDDRDAQADSDPWVRHVARMECLQGILKWVKAGVIAFVGVCALFIASPTPDVAIAPLSFIAGIAMMVLAVLVFLTALVGWVGRRTGPRARR